MREIQFQIKKFDEIPELMPIYKKCINNDVDKRPSIAELMFEIYYIFSSCINKSLMNKILDMQFLHDHKCFINKTADIFSTNN